MKTDKDLIFEAYTKTFNQNYNDVGVIEQLHIFIENHPEFSEQLSPIWNEMSEIAEELGKFDIDEDNIEDIIFFINNLNGVFKHLQTFTRRFPKTKLVLIPVLDELEDIIDELDGHYEGGHLNQDELYGFADRIGSGFAEDNESKAKNIQRGQEAISAAQEEYYKQFGAEAFESHYGFPYPHAEDNENYASEGAVNLLEQLKEEVPELEDKINQILEKVFDAVDILKQESYADDPQLVKAHDSLIEGDY